MVRKLVTNKNLRQKVYEEMKNFVVSNEVLPGEKIDENELAKKLGVSKTPIREALSKLALEGIVKTIPNRGSYKIKLSKADIIEIMVIREVLEGLCIPQATRNINYNIIKKLRVILDDFETKYLENNFAQYSETMMQFYGLIYDAAKNSRLVRIIKSMYDQTRMFRLLYFNNPERVRNSLRLHKEFIDVLEKRDEESAERIRKGMVRSSYEYLIEAASGNHIPHPLEPIEKTEKAVQERLKFLDY